MTQPRGWSELRSLVVNLHAGQAAKLRPRGRLRRRRSALAVLLRTHKPDVVVLLEVRSVADVRRAARGYRLVPVSLTGREGVVLLLRRRTITAATAWSAKRITAARDTMHPERRLVRADAMHKPSGRSITVLGVHLWAMGDGWRSPGDVVDKHVDQTKAFRDEAQAAVDADAQAIVEALGDYNEDLDDRDTHDGRTAVAIMQRNGPLTFAHRVTNQHGSTSLHGRSLLDDVAYRKTDWCELVSRRTVTIPDPGADHYAVATVHRIRSLT